MGEKIIFNTSLLRGSLRRIFRFPEVTMVINYSSDEKHSLQTSLWHL